MRSMDSILSDEKSVNDLPETIETTTEANLSETREAKADVVETKTEPAKQETGDETEQDEHVPDDLQGLKRALAAARGDKRKARKKWQEAEKAMAELRGKLSVTERQPKQPSQQNQPKKIDLTDEEFFGRGPEAVKAYVEHQVAIVREEQKAQWLNRSEAAARERYADFQEAYLDFQELAKAQPYLWAQMDNVHDPAEFVYRTGKTFRELKGVSNLDDLRKKIRAEVEAELQQRQSPGSAPPPPKSIAGARGTGSPAAQTWAGPRSLDDILG